MSYLVIDTSVFIHLNGKHIDVLICIHNNHDVIAISSGAISEYQAFIEPLLLQNFLNDLKSRKKLKFFGINHIEASVQRLLNARQKFVLPTASKR